LRSVKEKASVLVMAFR